MEEFNPENTTFYPVLGRDGELHAMIPDEYETAWMLAKSVDGWIGETTFAKPMDFQEVLGPEVGKEIEDFLENPQKHAVRRGRPGSAEWNASRSTNVDVESSTSDS